MNEDTLKALLVFIAEIENLAVSVRRICGDHQVSDLLTASFRLKEQIKKQHKQETKQ